ncbi:glycosyltransferase 87 family protein [Yinghuangia seranimata]|uniref:glycosyltransferase 87 family protein n=1 Tax=Yinghuangia seranimata TaxID=408067 RepID=UPI00248CFB3B|nr:glycosyltransferase 87 family protein [Yinghuangia seranimata]MDI2131897.1 glycosyltransferase 87 family protein [Yinghuangia seranimata]
MKHNAAGQGRASLVCLGVGIGLLLVTGLLGTSAAQPPVPGGPGWLPPYDLGGGPSAGLVTGLLLASALVGAVGLGLAMVALRAGWAPDPRRLTVAGAVAAGAVVLVPPMGSADHLVYAAYGRLAATGGNPYTETASDLARAGDPVGRAVEAPWQDTPSVYGPFATAEQWLASRIGGTSAHTTVFVLTLLGAVAFVLTGLLLQRLAGPDHGARSRVALLWSLNPLLLFVAVNAGHVDAFAVAFAVAALVAVRSSPVLAGVLVGLACATKVTLGLFVLALVWGLRRRPKAIAQLLGSAAVVGVLAYLPVGTDAFAQIRENSKLVSLATALRLTVHPLESVLAPDTARTLIGAVGWLLLVVVAWLLAPVVARAARRGPLGGEAVLPDAVGAAALLTLAWLLTAPYSLPWYDVAAWAPFTVLAASAADGLLLARTAFMVCAYVPGRAVPLPDAVDAFARTVRGTVGPYVGVALLLGALWLGLRARRGRVAG